MTTTSPRRRARTRAVTAGLATVIALVLATANPAGAAVSVSPPAGTAYVDTEQVTVSGTNASKPTADVVTIAQCDVTSPVVPGTRCTSVGATSFTQVVSGSFSVPNVELDQSWTTSWNYTVNPPTSSATPVSCATVGARDCAVLVSFYDAPNFPAGPFTHVGAETYLLDY